jgi:hypothetical protein
MFASSAPLTTTTAITSGQNGGQDLNWLVQNLWWYVSPTLIVLGTVFNGLTIIVLIKQQFGNTSTRILLINLAVSDTVILYWGLGQDYLQYCFGIEVRTSSDWSCPVVIFLSFFVWELTSWNVMLLTVERWVSVCFPIRARIICTKKYATWTVISVIVFIFLVNSHILRNFTIDRTLPGGTCVLASKSYEVFFTTTWAWIVFFVYTAIPYLTIALCNGSIIYVLRKSRRRRRTLSAETEDSAEKLSKITYMLLTVSTTFVLLTLPSSAFYFLEATVMSEDWHVSIELVNAVTSFLTYLNSTINFLLYCVSGTQFRRALVAMFKGTKS